MRRLAIALIACAGGALPAAAQAPAAPPAAAPGAPASGGLLGGNGPVDVSSETQERIDPTHLRLTGAVEVVQGQARLRSPQIDLFYPPRGQNVDEHAATAGGSLGKIERAEAEGPVYYVTPTETAKGDHGTYLAADDSITLTGNVVLTQGKNVSTGDKVVMHQKTGQAVLTAGKSGRTRAVLYPNEPAPAPGAPAGAAKPAPAAPAPAPPRRR